MHKTILTTLCVLISLCLNAQDKAKYLQGAVPEVDGKVVFTKTIRVNAQISEDNLFDLMNKWVQDNYGQKQGEGNRVLLSDPQKRVIAAMGSRDLTFKKSTLVLDQASMLYQLVLEISKGTCEATIRNIKYEYPDFKKPSPAEELITDKVALNGQKLNRYYDKFRIFTVDTINSIFNDIDVYLNGVRTQGVADAQQAAGLVPPPVMVVDEAVSNSIDPLQNTNPLSANLNGYKRISPDKIPGNIIKLLNDWMLITSGVEDNLNVMTASWGGLGVLWDRPIALNFINPTRFTVSTMEKGDTYTLSFYTEAYKEALEYCGNNSGRDTDKIKGSGLTPIKTPNGATAFSEAWMIIECRKIVDQQISSDAVKDKPLAAEWSKNGYHKIYIGEILNVWIK